MSRSSRILVVEDDPLVAQTIASALEEQYSVHLASTAATAGPQVQAGTIDLMLLDCLLPGGQVDDLMVQADTMRVPLVLMSGDLSRIETLGNGGRPFLGKPFTIDALLAAVARGLEQG